jgi:uncharacterized 2Fe-2S/4Fe-4S cluster protein (DUF4445 family)
MYKIIVALSALLLMQSNSFASEKGKQNVILDKKNAIYWQDTLFSEKSSEDWDDAIAYCEQLSLDGMKKWRLPTFSELLYIVDYTRSDPAIQAVFTYVNQGTYWTSVDFSATKSRAWTIDFRTGKTYYSYKTTNHSVRCVKDINHIEGVRTKDQK